MKTNLYKSNYLFLLLTVLFWLTSCKKDALKVKEQTKYFQINAPAPTGTLHATGISLELWPQGIAYINPGGHDFLWGATYKISGKKLTVKSGDYLYKFTIVSEEELHGENGEILKLFKM
jgi:hypothetical protein